MSKIKQVVDQVLIPVFRRRRRATPEEYAARQKRRGYVGSLQAVDSTPMAPPLGYVEHEPLALQIRRMVMSEQLRLAAESAGMESFEEADDFEMEDDPVDPKSPYENDFEPSVAELLKAGRAELERKAAAAASKPQGEGVQGGAAPPAEGGSSPPVAS